MCFFRCSSYLFNKEQMFGEQPPHSSEHPENNKENTNITSTFFQCECGKRYDAFPALYLHCKRKHNKRISCNPPPETHRSFKTNYCTINTYLLSSRSLPRHQQSILVNEGTQKKIKTIFEDFYKSKYYQAISTPISFQIVEEFKSFLINHLDGYRGKSQFEFFENVPHFFNQYYLYLKDLSSPIIFSNRFQFIKAILRFSEWFKQKGYTSLIAVENSSYQQESEHD